jgi:hypothetical protein
VTPAVAEIIVYVMGLTTEIKDRDIVEQIYTTYGYKV